METNEQGKIIYKKAMKLLNDNNYKEAAKYFKESTELLNDCESFFYLALCCKHLEQYDNAIEAINKAYEHNNHNNRRLINILKCKVDIQVKIHDYNGVISTCDLILSAAKEFISSFDLENLKKELNEKKMMMKCLEAGSEKSKFSEMITKGYKMEKQGSYKEAIEFYNKALDIDTVPKLYYNKGNCYKMLKLFPDAISSYSKYIELKRNNAECYDDQYGKAFFNQGLCYLEICDFDKALELFESLYRLASDNEMRSRTRLYISLAKKLKDVILP